jgi:leucyl/phenylalanyl-tRNA---protein transferase
MCDIFATKLRVRARQDKIRAMSTPESLALCIGKDDLTVMAARNQQPQKITTDMLLNAYRRGIFPMAESADDSQLYWIEPEARGILPLDGLTVPKRLAKTIRNTHLTVHVDRDFAGVIAGCAAAREGRENTWINSQIRTLYGELFRQQHCHTVEVWEGDLLVGGLYGVAVGGAFFGESMFSTRTDASKIALIYLCARLIDGGFKLLDTQFVTDHLRQFGTVEVDRTAFHILLDAALTVPDTDFARLAATTPPAEVLAVIARHQRSA